MLHVSKMATVASYGSHWGLLREVGIHPLPWRRAACLSLSLCQLFCWWRLEQIHVGLPSPNVVVEDPAVEASMTDIPYSTEGTYSPGAIIVL